MTQDRFTYRTGSGTQIYITLGVPQRTIYVEIPCIYIHIYIRTYVFIISLYMFIIYRHIILFHVKNRVQQGGGAGTHHPEEATELLKGTVMSFVRPSSLGWSG